MNFKLISLTLENFMCHKSFKLDFTSRVTLISGKNGSGKSAILDALRFCFDPTYKRGDSTASVVRVGEDLATIKLEAEYNGLPFVEDISIAIGKPVARSLIIDNVTLGSAAAKKLLKENFSGLANLMFSSQGEAEFSMMLPAQRAYYMKDLIGLSFDEYIERIETDLEHAKRLSAENEKTFIVQEVQYKNLTDRLADVESKIAQLKLLKTVDQAEVDELANLENIISESASKLSELSNKQSLLNDELKKVSDAKSRKESLEKSIEDKNSELSNIEVALKRLGSIDSSKVESLKEEYKELESESNKALEIKTEVASSLKTAKDRYSKVSQGQCPTCGREYETSEIESTKAEVERLEKENEQALSNYKEITSKLTESKAALSNAEKELDRAVLAKEKAESDITSIKRIIERSKSELSSISYDDSNISLLSKEIEELKASVGSINLTEQQSRRSLLMRSIAECKANEERLADQIAEKEKLSVQVEPLYNSMNTAKESWDRSANNVKTYKNARYLFQNVLPKLAIGQACDLVSLSMNKFIKEIFPGIQISLAHSTAGVEVTLNGRDSTGDRNSAKMCSGFENSAITIAFRLALADAYNLPILLLDEIDSDASLENSLRLFELILKSKVSQICVISHKPVEELTELIPTAKLVSLTE